MALSFVRIKTVAGNTAPPLTLTAKREGTAIDLTSASTVKLYIVDSTGTQTNSGHETCTITTAASGIVSYTRQAGDISSKAIYKGELKVTYVDSTNEVLYDIILIDARARLAGE